jgi:hypothetical protein
MERSGRGLTCVTIRAYTCSDWRKLCNTSVSTIKCPGRDAKQAFRNTSQKQYHLSQNAPNYSRWSHELSRGRGNHMPSCLCMINPTTGKETYNLHLRTSVTRLLRLVEPLNSLRHLTKHNEVKLNILCPTQRTMMEWNNKKFREELIA